MTAWRIARDGDRIELAGELRLGDARRIWEALERIPTQVGGPRVLDLSRATAIDGTVMALVVEFRRSLIARGTPCEIVGADAFGALFELYRGDGPPAAPSPPRRRGAIERLGASTARAGAQIREAIAFIGELTRALLRVAREPRGASWRSVPSLIERAGADAIPIVLLLDSLVGFVIAFQSMQQLELYGASIYVADLVGISATRELAPLMTAVIVSGRSGAAFAAELGAMRVNEEIDALSTIGLSPLPHLVLPRMIALAVATPLLTLVGDVAAIAGGLVVAASLDLTPHTYINELRSALVSSDVWTGLVKSLGFGIAIAIIGCHHGLATTGAAAGVGRGTTATVVACLFTIVVLDTLFTIVFRAFGV